MPVPKQYTTWLRTIINAPEAETGHSALAKAFEKLYRNSTGAIGVINQEFGRRYTVRRYGEWRRGYRDIPYDIQNFMRVQVLMSRFDKKTAQMLCKLLDVRLPGEDLLG